MNPIDEMNLTNLQLLWRLYGATTVYNNNVLSLNGIKRWPHRHWLDSTASSLSDKEYNATLSVSLEEIPNDGIFSLWQSNQSTNKNQVIKAKLLASDWQHSFKQHAMHLPLKSKPLLTESQTITLNPVSTDEQIEQWCEIGSAAFGYHIDINVITPLVSNKAIFMYLASVDKINVAASMLLHSQNCTGVHQVGVLPKYQGKGYAKAVMVALINNSIRLGAEQLVLQASSAGLPLYRSLGFIEQFTIENFTKK